MEFVYVVPRTELFLDASPQGVQVFGGEWNEEPVLHRIRAGGFFVERAYAETCPDLKQVIPYSLVQSGGQVLCLRRTRQGGEERLHDKLSIGVGGHINPDDLPGSDLPHGAHGAGRSRSGLIARATQREVAEEELILGGPFAVRRVGLINDDSNPVGAVHVGLVQVITVEGPVAVRETDQLEGGLVTRAELRARLADGANFETWSSLLIPHLDRLLSQSTAPGPSRSGSTEPKPTATTA